MLNDYLTMRTFVIAGSIAVGILLLLSLRTCGIPGGTSCTFCDIIAGKAPSVVIDEDDDVLVIEKRPIRNPANCLIIPKKHIESLRTLNPSDLYDSTIISKMAFMAQKLAKKLQRNQDFKVIINTGPAAGQTIFHLHMHFQSPYHWKNPTWRQP